MTLGELNQKFEHLGLGKVWRPDYTRHLRLSRKSNAETTFSPNVLRPLPPEYGGKVTGRLARVEAYRYYENLYIR